MTFETLGIAIAMLVIFVLWIGSPFFARREVRLESSDSLAQHYDRILVQLRDLEEDFSTGKIAQEAYQLERERLTLIGIKALKALDEEDPIELAVKKYRKHE
ncbi:MAG: hypothetical protein OHK0023_21640 [Anaerolineae bacterium]